MICDVLYLQETTFLMVPWFLNIAVGFFPLGPMLLSLEHTCESFGFFFYFHEILFSFFVFFFTLQFQMQTFIIIWNNWTRTGLNIQKFGNSFTFCTLIKRTFSHHLSRSKKQRKSDFSFSEALIRESKL